MSVPFKVNLSGKVAVVTGGSGVLGSCTAKALAECGAAVAVIGRRLSKAESVAGTIRKAGGRAIAISCDVLDRRSLKAANKRIEKEFGPVDILINAAGGNHPDGITTKEYLLAGDLKKVSGGIRTFYDLDAEGIKNVFNLNFLGAFIASQEFTRSMARRKRGVIINISSMAAIAPLTRIPAYSAAKAAVSNFTQWLAVHMSKVGIRVNAIAPGFFVTDQNRSLLTKKDGSLTARGKTILANTPMGRLGNPRDLIGAMLWLVSDEATGFVTGAVIPVDGGFSAFGGV
jgi:NAD(P)-dependent dehydrogenase (short-subunit alcohol dehydrogenase family)